MLYRNLQKYHTKMCLTIVALVYFKESTFNSVLCTSVVILEIHPRQTVYIVISPFSCSEVSKLFSLYKFNLKEQDKILSSCDLFGNNSL